MVKKKSNKEDWDYFPLFKDWEGHRKDAGRDHRGTLKEFVDDLMIINLFFKYFIYHLIWGQFEVIWCWHNAPRFITAVWNRIEFLQFDLNHLNEIFFCWKVTVNSLNNRLKLMNYYTITASLLNNWGELVKLRIYWTHQLHLMVNW